MIMILVLTMVMIVIIEDYDDFYYCCFSWDLSKRPHVRSASHIHTKVHKYLAPVDGLNAHVLLPEANPTNPDNLLVNYSQRVPTNYMVESGVSILGITIMIWGTILHNHT